MKLETFIKVLGDARLITTVRNCNQANISREVTGITYNSNNVKAGNIFICKGTHFKKQYLLDAIEDKACCYISDTDFELNDDTLAIVIKDVRAAMPIISKLYFGDLSKEISMIGITGTKGKSTTTYITKQILDDYLESVGANSVALSSGIENYDGKTLSESHLTTPENLELYEHMNNAINSDISHMVMEVSSQALKYRRVDGITYEVGCFLNIGEDHISPIEHPDYEDYLQSKLSIFGACKKACINLDCKEQDSIRREAARCKKVISFSQKYDKANVFAKNINSMDGIVSFDLIISGVEGYSNINTRAVLAAFGTINIENALAATSIAVALQVPIEFILSWLSKAVAPGRMELFRSQDGKKVVLVDYAHNAMSFESLFKTVKQEFPNREAVIVFGCVGDKSFSRRESLGLLAGKVCKKSYLTEQHSGEEDCFSICKEIGGYIDQAGGEYEIIVDRNEALRKAIEEADENIVVLAAGKGRETTQKRGTEFVPVLSDVEIAIESLK